MLVAEYRSAIIVVEHVSSKRSFDFVTVDVLHWGFLFILPLFTLFSLFSFG